MDGMRGIQNADSGVLFWGESWRAITTIPVKGPTYMEQAGEHHFFCVETSPMAMAKSESKLVC